MVELKNTRCKYHIDYAKDEQIKILISEILKEKEGRMSAESIPKF